MKEINARFVLRSEREAADLKRMIDQYWRGQIVDGKPLVIYVGEDVKARNLWQNRKMHGIFQSISERAMCDGEKQSPAWWKTFFKFKFLPTREIVNPFTGEVHELPVSTADLTERQCSDFILQIEAYCATEIGISTEVAA